MKHYSIISSVEDILSQGRGLLSAVMGEADEHAYTRPLGGPPSSSIGGHYRHILDHFHCLLEGIRNREINYDRRQRNPEVESSPVHALIATETLIDTFRGLTPEVLERDCSVVYSVTFGEELSVAVRSTFLREAMFCIGHAIHHFAIVKILCSAVSVRLPYEFGVAPSTLQHLAASGGAGRPMVAGR